MPTSPYFPQYYSGYEGEQNLIQDLADEQIKLFGTDIYYLPREILKTNTLDDIIFSKFEKQFQIEMYLQNVEGFGNDSEFISKFGLKITDEIRFVVSQRRWFEEATANNYVNILRPLEGDLLYFPLTKDLYEIKFVEIEAVFRQFGKLQFYQITAEIYEIGNETIDTGIAEIDLVETVSSPAINIIMRVNSGTGNYVVGESITTSISGITSEVSQWNSATRTLTVINRTGDFVEGELVTGSVSGAQRTILSFETIEDPNTEYDQNKYLEDESDTMLDFSEKNPFGEYGNFTGSF